MKTGTIYFAGAVFCPRCHADPGEPCWTDDGKNYTPIHSERIENAVSYADNVAQTYKDSHESS